MRSLHLQRNNCILWIILSFSLISCVWAEDTQWVLAAEKFTTDQVPSVYEEYASVIPNLLISKLSTVSLRKILPDEANARLLKQLSDKKMVLISERAKLIFSRDMLLFSNESLSSIQKKEKAILLQIDKKTLEITTIDLEIDTVLNTPSSASVINTISLWKDGKELFVSQDNTLKSTNLKKAGISALITGEIEDLAGYMCVTITIETGLSGFPISTVTVASRYEELEKIVNLIAIQLFPVLSNRDSVELILSITTENARIFIDNRLLSDTSSPLFLNSGEHHIRCEAPGYVSAQALYDFSEKKRYSIAIDLQKKEYADISFTTNLFPATLYIGGNTFKSDEDLFKTPYGSHIGEIVSDDAKTWFVLDIPNGDQFEKVSIQKNKVNTKKRIDTQRNLFYNSLGALYLSLPVTLLLKGQSDNMVRGYKSGRLENNSEMVNTINSWTTASMISQGISITLGINVIVQIVRYFIAAEQVIPEQGKTSAY